MPSVGVSYIDKYFEESKYRVSQHQLASYDDFLNNKIPAIIAEGNRSFVMLKSDKTPPAEFRVEIRDLKYVRPTVNMGDGQVKLMPNICRTLGMSYALSLFATVTIHVLDISSGHTHNIDFEDILIARIPLMLHSEMCYLRGAEEDELIKAGEDPADPGGYFITWGAEKTIVTQERAAPNVPIIAVKRDTNDKKEVVLSIRSAPPENTVRALTTQVVIREAEKGAIFVRMQGRFIADVDMATVFRAMGVESDRDIVMHVAPGNNPRDKRLREMMRPSLMRAHDKGVWTQAQALEALAPLTPYGSNLISTRSDAGNSRGKTHAMYILRRELLAGIGEDFGDKTVYLGLLVRKALLGYSGMEEPTDREAIRGKRLFTAGMLFTEVFDEAYGEFRRSATNRMDRAWYHGPWRGSGDVRRVVTKANVTTIFNHDEITSVLQSSMRGNWGKHGLPEEGGIVQDLSRLSWLQFLSHLRRVNNPLDRSLKIVEPHYLHSTQWGVLCPVESPDGANIGLTNNLAITCEITAALDPAPVKEALASMGAQPLSVVRDDGVFIVHVNGVPMFQHTDPFGVARSIKAMRRSGELHHHTSVRVDVFNREVRVATDGGRCSRPLVVKKSKPSASAPSWAELLADGIIEYVDAEEMEDALVAWEVESMEDRHTHAEMHFTCGLSVFEVTMPFVQHNPAARNVLAAQQGKQGAGLYTSSFRSRIDTVGMVLNYPQLPLVRTRYEGITKQSEHPGGINTIVAIMCWTGFNMEDGILVNKSAVDRGLFGMTYLKNHIEEEDVSGDGSEVRFGNPTSAASLDKYGMPRENEAVIPGELLFGKMKSTRDGGFVPVDGAAMRADERWAGYVTDKVFVYDKPGEDNKHGLKTAKIRYRKLRQPKLGDKLAARHAQKGVIGVIVPEAQMPYTEDGIIPDIIINPHGIPSRMTLGQFWECLGAKTAAAATGQRADGTAMEPIDAEGMRAALIGAGFDKNCNEVMYDGNGQQIRSDIFIAPTYYQRLKQMVEDKINYRGGKGARDNVTNQPVGGRARGGGLRMGEMEYWAVEAHGLMAMATENTTGRSDGTVYSWTDANGAPAIYNEEDDYFRPTSAPDVDKRFRRRRLPRAFLTLQHELNAMSLDMRLSSEDIERVPSEHGPKSCGKDDPFAE